jgi:hypothetical protein
MANMLDQDRLFLEESFGDSWEVVVEGANIWVLLHDFPLPDGYAQKTVTLAIRMESGYPLSQLDMMYVHPAITRTDGKSIPQTEVSQPLDQKQFQRWSRHRTANNSWVPNQDGLENHVYFIEEAFRSEFIKRP